ncbi:bis(5'-nucleosyl)-tetraphosphatase (symmetrical) YqeK [Bacillus sp. FJAT-45350]|uniref:bis(5'-nucleosyl)-tetraphosphatase (symmetrical) YqeK n=1 Tax=Bacillus sp. FJAT-45350 TaxID=2011014 RepID=UPI000BB8AD33|nr:bis(5'-nucleosyl)-tetraphosphatase (symmetrical) YqeK [Bacillus sp. FJAT-45350]
MDKNKALSIVKEQLTDHRYQHTIGVMATAVELSKRYGVDEKKAETAAIFHDYAKFRDKDEMRSIIIEQGFPEVFLHYGTELLHAPCGAYLVKKEVGIIDQEILDAIYYHTTGRQGMTQLEKVVYLADYIEPGRSFKGVDEVRELAKQDLDKAIIQSIVNTISFLMKKGQPIFPETLATYNELIQKGKQKGRD